MKVFLFLLVYSLLIVGCSMKQRLVQQQNINHEICDTTTFSSIAEAKKYPHCVKLFYLREREYLNFPIEVIKFTEVEDLDLAFNKIDTLPKEIKALRRLKYLNLSHCSLSYISPAIGTLDSLEELGLVYTKITHLPSEICKLKQLRSLSLVGTNIATLPDCICEMKNLESLGLSYHKGYPHIDSVQIKKLKRCLPNTYISFYEID